MPAGRPLKFKTPQELDEAIDKYFASCYDTEGKIIKAITYTGLAIALGTTRQTLLDYREKDEFTDSVTRAKAKCEEFAESQLFIGKNPSGAQFALTNNYDGWAAKQDVNLGGQKNNPIETKEIRPSDQEIINHYLTIKGKSDARHDSHKITT